MDVEIVINSYYNGGRRDRRTTSANTETVTRFEGLTEDEAHDFRRRLSHVCLQFEQDLRDSDRQPPYGT